MNRTFVITLIIFSIALSACSAALPSNPPRYIEVSNFPIGRLSIACHLFDLSDPTSLKVLWTKSGTFTSDKTKLSYIVTSNLVDEKVFLEIRDDGVKIIDTSFKAKKIITGNNQLIADFVKQTEINDAVETAYKEWNKDGKKYSCPDN